MPKFLDAPSWYGIGTNPSTPELLKGLALPSSGISGGAGQIPFITNNTAQYGTLSRTSIGNSGEYLKTGGSNSFPYWGLPTPLKRHFINANGGGKFTYIDDDNTEQTFSAAYANKIYISIFNSKIASPTVANGFISLLTGAYSPNEVFPVYVSMDSMISSGSTALNAIFWTGYYEQEVEGATSGYFNLKLLGYSWLKDNPKQIFKSSGSIRIARPVDFSEYTDTVTDFYQP